MAICEGNGWIGYGRSKGGEGKRGSSHMSEALESITHDNLEATKACVPKVEAKLVVNVDA